MLFDNFASAHSFVLWAAFGIAFVMGAVVNKTNFCTMGAVSDLVNMNDTGRLRAWMLAMAIAILGVTLFEAGSLIHGIDASRPPYRASTIAWLDYVVGGIMFGVGMTLGSGCGNKTLIRIGGGNLKSIFVFALISVFAYFMINPFPGSDKTLYSLFFYPWMNPVSISASTNQDLGALAGSVAEVEKSSMRLWVGLLIAAAILFFVLRSADFRSSKDNIIGGLVVGLAVIGAWYVSAGLVNISADGEIYSWVQFASNDVWEMVADGDAPSGVAAQSYTFINPIGEATGYLLNGVEGMRGNTLTFGMMAVFGVIAGSLVWSVLTKSFRIEWFVDFKDFATHLVGGILMGVGGVLALGCTIGQAVTGVSTLAIGSFLAFISIVFGSALTMKIQYYRMVYEDDATFIKALVTALVDMKLLPGGMRQLDAI